MKRIISIGMVLFIFVVGCSQKEYSIVATQTTGESLSLCASLPEERITESAFKGIELFSYQNEVGEWVFSVLVGTNVTKTYDQVLSDPLTIEELGDCLCKMAADEYVFWLNQALGSSADELLYVFPTPPDSLIYEVENLAETCEINLWVDFDS